MENVKGAVRRWGESTFVKLATLGLLVLVLLIPVARITALVGERMARQSTVAGEIAGQWGGPQFLVGPVLTVPYSVTYATTETVTVEGADGAAGAPKTRTTRSTRRLLLHALPAEVAWRGRIEPEIRYRGLFEVVVYEARLAGSGVFVLPAEEAWEGGEPDWRHATLALGIPDARGLQGPVRLAWGDREIGFVPGTAEAGFLGAGIHAPLAEAGAAAPGRRVPFSFELALRGSGDLHFQPAGEQTRVEIASPWPDPGFTGAFLPGERRIDEAGFTAAWKVPYYGREYPQLWRDGAVEANALARSAFGVSLVLPADAYQQTERSVKYAVLFIGLTFATFFLLELLSPARLHAVQYLLVGFALCLFYVLLLALAEHLGFAPAYAVAATATVGLVAAYSRSILAGGRWAALVLACLAALYGYLFVVLRLEDYALLLGAMGLFVVLALVMRLTRHLDWFALRFRGNGRDGARPLQASSRAADP
jgi:inner membrane protein